MTRKDAFAGVVLAGLALAVVVGWWFAPGESGGGTGQASASPAGPHGDGAALIHTAATASDSGAGAVTATILGFMIAGAMLIGLFFHSPRPVPILPRKQQRPRRSGAVTVDVVLRQLYSSIAPGAVLETVIRNSTLLLVFLSRSTSRSMA